MSSIKDLSRGSAMMVCIRFEEVVSRGAGAAVALFSNAVIREMYKTRILAVKASACSFKAGSDALPFGKPGTCCHCRALSVLSRSGGAVSMFLEAAGAACCLLFLLTSRRQVSIQGSAPR